MTDNILPEEKLLRLIRGEKKSAAKTTPVPVADSPKKQRINLFLPNFSALNFNRIVKALLVISSLWLIFLFLQPSYVLDEKKQPKPVKTSSLKAQNILEIKEQIKPYSFYLEGIKGRQIFSSAAAEGSQKAIGTASADLIKDINLVGIISGDEPQAVIEDKKAQKTYYLKKGQYIGELQLEDILEGKIVLNYNGQNYELYL